MWSDGRRKACFSIASWMGQVAYFRREPVNLFRFSDEAKQRREKAGKAPKVEKFALQDHLKQVIAEAERTGQTEVTPIKHRIKYSATIAPNAPGAKVDSLVRCWLPFPQEYRQQRDVKLISSSPEAAFVAPTSQGETTITGTPQRTVYLEQRVTDPSKPMTFAIEFEFTSSAYYPKLDDAKASPRRRGRNSRRTSPSDCRTSSSTNPSSATSIKSSAAK
jgi:hypothetical protein